MRTQHVLVLGMDEWDTAAGKLVYSHVFSKRLYVLFDVLAVQHHSGGGIGDTHSASRSIEDM